MKTKPLHALTPLEKQMFDHATFAWFPAKETEAQGKLANAIHLAHALTTARAAGHYFHWTYDDTTTADFSDDAPEYRLLICQLFNSEDILLSCMSAVDLGPGHDTRQPYARVIEAELCAENVADLENVPEPENPAAVLLARGLECGVFDDAPAFKADVQTLLFSKPDSMREQAENAFADEEP